MLPTGISPQHSLLPDDCKQALGNAVLMVITGEGPVEFHPKRSLSTLGGMVGPCPMRFRALESEKPWNTPCGFDEWPAPSSRASKMQEITALPSMEVIDTP